MDHIVGMMWNRNEGDILEEIIENALPHVDSLFIADDGSTDDSWPYIQSIARRRPDKIEYIRNQRTNSVDRQRTPMLGEIRKRYKAETTWVQIIESDVMIVDTNIRDCIAKFAVEDMALTWQTLNAVRRPGTWAEFDTYPKWKKPIKEIMPYQHLLEAMLYTFRPLPMLYYDQRFWRPWPKGFSNYTKNHVKVTTKYKEAPLLGHYGYRGPMHVYRKFNPEGKKKCMSPNGVWDFSTPATVEATVPFFNGGWNKGCRAMSRGGWKRRKSDRPEEEFDVVS